MIASYYLFEKKIIFSYFKVKLAKFLSKKTQGDIFTVNDRCTHGKLVYYTLWY